MIRFYSLFVTDDELLASPYVRRFNVFHDLTLHRGKTEEVNFLLQAPIDAKQYKRLSVIYDPLALTLHKVEVKSFPHQTLLTAKLTPKEIGSIRIGFAFPQSEHLHQDRMKKISSPLTSIPCRDIGKGSTLTIAK